MNGPVPTGVGAEFPLLYWSIMACPNTYPTCVARPAVKPGFGPDNVYRTVSGPVTVHDTTWVRAWPVRRDAFSAAKLLARTVAVRSLPSLNLILGRRTRVQVSEVEFGVQDWAR